MSDVTIRTMPMGDLTDRFAAAVVAGDRAGLGQVLSPDVVYQAPGRSAVAGLHRGRDRVVEVLCAAAAEGATIDPAIVTETMVDGRRAFVVVLMTGSTALGRFAFEVGFHLQSDGELVVGVTEYSGDQYTADALLGSPP